MLLLIGALFLLALAWDTYHLRDRLLRRTQSRNPVLRRMLQDIDHAAASDSGPEEAEEDREAELSQRLFTGDITPTEYQQAMTQLAQQSSRPESRPR